MSNNRIVLLAQAGTSTNILFHAINAINPIESVILEKAESKYKFIQRRINRLGYLTVMGQLAFMAFQRVFLKPRSRGRRQRIIMDNGLCADPIPEDRITSVSSCNSEDCRVLLKAIDPALVLINGTRIISKKTIQSSGCPLINIHAGITPKYRGVHGGYWALRNGEPQLCGVSLHVIDEGIDTGAVIDQALISPSDTDSFLTYPLLQLSKGLELLKNHLPDLLIGRVTIKQPLTNESALWYHPTLWSFLSHKVK